MNRRTLLWGLIAVVAFTIAIQFVPVPGLGKDPPVVAAPNWDSTATKNLAVRACFDCHSNQTNWPWYGRIAPISWVVSHHVAEGRGLLDFSNPARARVTASRAARAVTSKAMPPFYYSWVHPEARLTAAQRLTLAQGLLASLGGPASGTIVRPSTSSRASAPDDLAPLPGVTSRQPSDAGARPGPAPSGAAGTTADNADAGVQSSR
jgi:hypothetical protein